MPITLTIIKFQLLFKWLWTIILSFNIIGVSWFQVHRNTYLRWLVFHISFRNHKEHCSPHWNKSSGLFNLKFLHFVCYFLSFITVFDMSWTIFPNSLFIHWQLPKASTVQSSLFVLLFAFFSSFWSKCSHFSGFRNMFEEEIGSSEHAECLCVSCERYCSTKKHLPYPQPKWIAIVTTDKGIT